MLLGRAAIYFDEVARQGALRRAADVLHIARLQLTGKSSS
jgi:DNA-binding transcriptional LysR family regulator